MDKNDREQTHGADPALEEYRRQVVTRILTNSPDIFGNYSDAHAACVVEAFAHHAEKEIMLMSGAFSSKFYTGPVFDELRQAAERGVKIRIVTSDAENVDLQNLLTLAAAKTKEKPEEHPVSFFVTRYSGDGAPTHFMVVDGKRYRLERGTHAPNDERPVVQAEVCCNGPQKAKALADFFNNLWKRLEAMRQAAENAKA